MDEYKLIMSEKFIHMHWCSITADAHFPGGKYKSPEDLIEAAKEGTAYIGGAKIIIVNQISK